MDYQLDPRDEVQMLNDIWSEYEQCNQMMLANLAESVVSWKWATSAMLPEHPLFGQADTTPQAEPWRRFKDGWIADDDPQTKDLAAGQHGFDADSRVILIQKTHYGIAYFHHDGYCNQFRFRRDNDTGVRIRDEYQRCKRIVYNDAGRINHTARYSHEYGAKYYIFEWFKYDGDVCVSSMCQNFNLMPEIPHYQNSSSRPA